MRVLHIYTNEIREMVYLWQAIKRYRELAAGVDRKQTKMHAMQEGIKESCENKELITF